jgi:hypothetical protein
MPDVGVVERIVRAAVHLTDPARDSQNGFGRGVTAQADRDAQGKHECEEC